MTKPRIPYHRLSIEDPEQPELEGFPQAPRPSPSRHILFLVIFLETLVLLWWTFRAPEPKCFGPGTVYSPAEEAIEYGTTSYAIGQNERFRIPPSPQLDEAWNNLYNFGISQIPKSQAVLLPNKTHPIPGDEENYIVELDVFHNLHCLNMIRKRIHSDYYPDSLKMEISHMDHCIDWVRQSLMCAGDTSVIVWQWDPAQNITTFQGDVAHTCRNFDKLREWGKSHKIRTFYDTSVRIEDDIVVPVIPKAFDLDGVLNF
ncbi:hypothetical protein B0H17DRAFT_1056873 [Mycena rosella]|uniref:Tat pathway signal sequence n=1 Tax=Mycena rosella TaxID=1033263 RepID=A0AAD7GMK4_MYCRO|nr:hypothetical protein B0H17DRAFT_1056873 [Mycena rosella]